MGVLAFDYTDPSDFTFDIDKVELVGGQMKLKLQEAAQVFTEDFADDTGFTYTAAEAEFSAGVIQSKDKLPTNAVCAATHTTDQTLAMATFSPLTGTLVGTPSFVTNVMSCTGLQGSRYTNAAIGAIAGAGAIKFKYTPNYTTAPPANIDMVQLLRPTSGNHDRIGLTHSPSGNTIRLWLYNSSSTSIYVATAIGPAFTPTAGVEYEMELNWDSTAGVVRLFINGALHGTKSPGAWSRNTTATELHIAGTARSYSRAEGDFSDVVLYSAVQHTAGYTSGYIVSESRYLETSVTLPVFTHTGVGTMLSYTGLTLTSETGAIRYQIKTDSGLYKYWNGSAWANSDGTYAQSNTSADMNTNLPALVDANGAISVYIKMILPAGTTQSSIAEFSLNHTGHTGYPATDEIVEGVSVARTAGVNSIAANQIIPSGDSVGWFVLRNGLAFYWTGSVWASSSKTPATSNTLATLVANITSFEFDRQEMTLGFILTSNDQTTTPYVDSTSINFKNTLEDPSTNTLVFLEGFIYDHDGPEDTVKIQVRPYSAGHTNQGVFHIHTYKDLDTTNSDGYFNAYIYANAPGQQWEFKIGDQSYRATVPNQSSVDWKDIPKTKVE